MYYSPPPTFQNLPPVFEKFNSFLHTLRVIFPPTLTMMHLCITQCTYWTPLHPFVGGSQGQREITGGKSPWEIGGKSRGDHRRRKITGSSPGEITGGKSPRLLQLNHLTHH